MRRSDRTTEGPPTPGMSHVGEVGTRMVLPMVGMSDTILTTRTQFSTRHELSEAESSSSRSMWTDSFDRSAIPGSTRV